jgi:hypothetical protein
MIEITIFFATVHLPPTPPPPRPSPNGLCGLPGNGGAWLWFGTALRLTSGPASWGWPTGPWAGLSSQLTDNATNKRYVQVNAWGHRLNMEVDWATCAQLYSLAETPQPPKGALLVSKDRRHLFVTPCLGVIERREFIHQTGAQALGFGLRHFLQSKWWKR